jgi:Zn ribbon nucleic-acid-binding protein
MKVRFCPRCKSKDLDLVAGGNIGMLECRKCKYRGSIFPEKEERKKKNEK